MHEAADSDAEEDRVRKALDLLVFAPLGLALTVIEDLPGLVDKGRQRVESDLRNARFVGELVVTQGQREATKLIGRFLNPEDSGSPPSAEGGSPSPAAEHPARAEAPAPVVPPPAHPTKPAADPADNIIVEAALAGYDALSASQVVRRLESLGPDELRAVHRHEASHRNRRTIINRAHQLLDGAGAPHAPEPPQPEPAPPSDHPPQ